MIQTFKGYDIQYYEVSMDYDDNGYVNKVTIETRQRGGIAMIINICLIIVIIITGILLIDYNRFVRKNNRVKERQSHIDVLLNQRFDLIPNIVETVKGYAKHESSTLEELVNLRSSYNNKEFSIEETEKVDKNLIT